MKGEITVFERSQALVRNLELKRANKRRRIIQDSDVCDIDCTHYREENPKSNSAEKNPRFIQPLRIITSSFCTLSNTQRNRRAEAEEEGRRVRVFAGLNHSRRRYT